MRRPRSTLLCAALLTVAAATLAVRELRPTANLLELLPQSSPAAQAYAELLERFGALDRVVVAVRLPARATLPKDSDPIFEAILRLEDLLPTHEPIAEIRTGVRPEEMAFLLDQVVLRAPLLLPGEDWSADLGAALAPEALERRAQDLARQARMPTSGTLAPLLVRDPLGLAARLPGLDPGAWGLDLDPLTGTFRSSDGRSGLVILTTTAVELDAAAGHVLQALLADAAELLRREIHPDLELLAVGGPLYAAEDERLLRRDLQLTVTTSAGLCSLLLVLALGGVRLPMIALTAVAVALVWTAGLMAVVFGSVAALSLGFAAILVGLGIDYGIHGCIRLLEERSRGADPERALLATLEHTGPPILASALTTAGAFAVLAFAGLRPLRELGLLVAIGMLAMLAATLWVAAPLATLASPRPRPVEGRLWRAAGTAVETLVSASRRSPRNVVAIAALVLLFTLPGVPRLELDADLRALRPVDHATLAAEAVVTQTFDLGFDTTTVLVDGPDLDSALDEARAATATLRQRLGHETAIDSPSDWILGPRERNARLAIAAALPIAPAARQLEVELRRAGLDPRAFRPGLDALLRLARGEDPGPAGLGLGELPDFLREAISQDQAGAVTVAIRLRLSPTAQASQIDIRHLLEEEGIVARLASPTAVGAELAELARHDLSRLLILAGIVVVMLVAISFRGRPWRVIESLLPATLGAVSTLGFWGLIGGRLDLISVAVLPILLGIGVDDGLHAVHASRSEDEVSGSVLTAGRAMFLTTLTTAIAFASLTLSSMPGLRRGGALVAVGVTACLLATLTVLPAIGALRARRRPSEPEAQPTR